MRTGILERLAAGDVLVADGATGTMMQAAGLPPGVPTEAWVLDRPEEIVRLHKAYVDAGSQIILTTTFGGTRGRLAKVGLAQHIAVLNRQAARLAREAAGDDRYVAGDIGPTGELMAPLGRLTHEEAVQMFAEQAEALASGGVDIIYIETMSDLAEARAAVLGAQQGCQLPVFCTFSFDHHGRTAMGLHPRQAAAAMQELGVTATGANCGHAPEELLEILPAMHQAAPNCTLVAKPNAGLPRMVKRQVFYDATPERMAELALSYVQLGARIVGGCCGSTPAHIAAICRAVAVKA